MKFSIGKVRFKYQSTQAQRVNSHAPTSPTVKPKVISADLEIALTDIGPVFKELQRPFVEYRTAASVAAPKDRKGKGLPLVWHSLEGPRWAVSTGQTHSPERPERRSAAGLLRDRSWHFSQQRRVLMPPVRGDCLARPFRVRETGCAALRSEWAGVRIFCQGERKCHALDRPA